MESMLRLNQLDQLAAQGKSLAAVDAPVALDLIAASSDKERTKLRHSIALMEVKMGIMPGQQWARSSEQFSLGMEELKRHKVQKCRSKVGALVAEVRQDRLKTKRLGTSTANTKRHHKMEATKRRRLNSFLQEMYLWQCFGTNESPSGTALTDEQIKGMLKGAPPPWVTSGEGADSTATLLHHGRVFYMAREDHTRLEEEELYLRIEKRRLLRRLQLRVRQLEQALHALLGDEGAIYVSMEKQRQAVLASCSPLDGCASNSLQDGQRYALAYHLLQARHKLASATGILSAIPAP